MVLEEYPLVCKSNIETRLGRGFSRNELKKAGIGPRQALQSGLPIDSRRRTVHELNVKLIKQRLKTAPLKSKSSTGRKTNPK